MARFFYLISSALVLLILAACHHAPVMPETFVRGQSSNWVTIEVTRGMSKEQLWGKITDSLKERDLEFEKLDKDAGYMRTGWNYTITAEGKKRRSGYATRVTIDIPSDGKTVRIKTEAQYLSGNSWISGFDTAYNKTFKDEISAIVGYRKSD